LYYFSFVAKYNIQPNGKCPTEFMLNFKKKLNSNSGVELHGVDVRDGKALFEGSSYLKIWRYLRYDYTDKLQVTFKFKPTSGPRTEPYTLVSNCEGDQEPSFGIVLNTFKDLATFFLKTYETESQKFMTFRIDVSINMSNSGAKLKGHEFPQHVGFFFSLSYYETVRHLRFSLLAGELE
jgi:hypothetical protein